MTNFLKPGGDRDYPELGAEAISKALADAGIPYNAIEQACVGYVYGDSTCGQKALYEVGITGIPVYNVNNSASKHAKHPHSDPSSCARADLFFSLSVWLQTAARAPPLCIWRSSSSRAV